MKRTKRRYLALQIESEASFHPKILMDAIWRSILTLYGEYGASQTNLSLIDYNLENNQLIIRTNLSSLNIVRTSLVTITSIDENYATVHVLSISGTIKSLKEKIKMQSSK